MAAIVNYSVRRYLGNSLARQAKVRVEGPSAVSGGHEGGYKLWRNMSFFVAFPAIALCAINCYITHEHTEQPEFVKYDYLRIRSKRFPWGEGQKSLFHNSHTNALPDGFEAVEGHH